MEIALLLLGLLPLLFLNEEDDGDPEDIKQIASGDASSATCGDQAAGLETPSLLDVALQPMIEDDTDVSGTPEENALLPSEDAPDFADFAQNDEDGEPLAPLIEDDHVAAGSEICEDDDEDDGENPGLVLGTRARGP